MKQQLLIFDLDGTLVDSRGDLAAAVNHMRAHFGMTPLPVDTVTGFIGDGARELVRRSLDDFPEPVDIEEALRIKSEYYSIHLTDQTETYPGVVEGIRALSKAGHKLGLLTNKPGEASRTIMKHFGLASYFAVMIGGGDMVRLKPAPNGVNTIMAITGKWPKDSWMIGDHHTDLMTAQNAGIKGVLAEYGFGKPNGVRADVQFSNFVDLTRFFLQGDAAHTG